MECSSNEERFIQGWHQIRHNILGAIKPTSNYVNKLLKGARLECIHVHAPEVGRQQMRKLHS